MKNFISNLHCKQLGIMVAWILSAHAALATSFAPQPFPVTVQSAPVIIRGTIGTSYSDWGRDEQGTRKLYTFYEVQVSEIFKGQATQSTLTIRELGGEKDGIGMNVEGASHFEKNEDVIIFLKDKNSEGSFDVHGLMMGKYNVKVDAEGKEYLTGAGLFGTPENKGFWSIEALRKLVKNQSKLASPQTSASPSPAPSSVPSLSSPLTATTPSSLAQDQTQNQAPQLQTHGTIIGILSIIFVIIFVGITLRKTKK